LLQLVAVSDRNVGLGLANLKISRQVTEEIMFRKAAALFAACALFASGFALAAGAQRSPSAPQPTIVGKMLASITAPTQKDALAK